MYIVHCRLHHCLKDIWPSPSRSWKRACLCGSRSGVVWRVWIGGRCDRAGERGGDVKGRPGDSQRTEKSRGLEVFARLRAPPPAQRLVGPWEGHACLGVGSVCTGGVGPWWRWGWRAACACQGWLSIHGQGALEKGSQSPATQGPGPGTIRGRAAGKDPPSLPHSTPHLWDYRANRSFCLLLGPSGPLRGAEGGCGRHQGGTNFVAQTGGPAGFGCGDTPSWRSRSRRMKPELPGLGGSWSERSCS